LPTFAQAWLAHDSVALRFLPTHAELPDRPVDPRLLAALRAQHSDLPPDPTRDHSLHLLGQPHALAVVTGQQLGLCLGPLYTVYKAAAAIVAARALAEQTQRPCIPVFWLQTEDHDFPEIDHTFVPRPTGTLRLSLADSHPTRMPVAHRTLGPSVLPVLDALQTELAHQPHGPALLTLLREAYRPEATLVQAFRRVLAEVFHGQGLVFLDPRDPAIAPLAAPLHLRLLNDAQPLSELLTDRAHALDSAGFTPQVHVRPGAPLSFFSPDAIDGPRYRMQPAAPETWTLGSSA
jgi:bacillithiol biosynthesis cysteine-adding enzyme BshC